MLGLRPVFAAMLPADAQLGAAERLRREKFIALRLTLTLPFMTLAPVYLLAHGAPSNWDALAFAFLLAPVSGVYVLHRSGNFALAQTISAGGLLLLGVALALSDGGLSVGAVSCFLLALLETALAGEVKLAATFAACSLGLTSAVMLASLLGWLAPESGEALADPLAASAAALYGALLVVSGARTGEKQAALAGAGDFRAMVALTGVAPLRLDASGSVAEIFGGGEALPGLAGAELMGRGLFERVLVSDRPAFLKAVSDAAHGAEVKVEFRLRGAAEAEAEAGYIEVELRALPLRAAEGVVLGALRDMTEHRAIREARQAGSSTPNVEPAASAAEDWRQRLLANVSHELRTPLNAIIGFSEMLANVDLTPKDPVQQREYARIINASGQHLLSVVNTILDMSKIESGVFAIEPEHFNLGALIDFSCDLVKLKAQEKNIELLAACGQGLEEVVADKRAIKQILLNLLSNAVKFTPEGGRVAISARPDAGFVEINVADTGIGVNPAELERLGDPFFQARSTYDRPYEGAGLGLSIVRGLVALHGGAISFESAPNEGASVTVRLPLDCRHIPRSDALTTRINGFHRRGAAQRAGQLNSNDQVKKIA